MFFVPFSESEWGPMCKSHKASVENRTFFTRPTTPCLHYVWLYMFLYCFTHLHFFLIREGDPDFRFVAPGFAKRWRFEKARAQGHFICGGESRRWRKWASREHSFPPNGGRRFHNRPETPPKQNVACSTHLRRYGSVVIPDRWLLHSASRGQLGAIQEHRRVGDAWSCKRSPFWWESAACQARWIVDDSNTKSSRVSFVYFEENSHN